MVSFLCDLLIVWFFHWNVLKCSRVETTSFLFLLNLSCLAQSSDSTNIYQMDN